MVHHTPGKYPRVGLEKISGTCQGYALECRLWEEPFDPERHYELQLKMLKEFIDDVYDWIIIAESDEFQQWPTGLIRYGVLCLSMNEFGCEGQTVLYTN